MLPENKAQEKKHYWTNNEKKKKRKNPQTTEKGGLSIIIQKVFYIHTKGKYYFYSV